MNNDSEMHLLKKGKHGLARLLYGRTLIILLSLIFQIVFILALFYKLEQYSSYIYIAFIVLDALAILEIFSNDFDPTVKMTWLVILIICNPFGWVIYFYDKFDIGHLKLMKRAEIVLDGSRDFQRRPDGVFNEIRERDTRLYNTCKYLGSAGGYYPYFNQGVEYYASGEKFLDSFLYDLSHAQEFIFLEYFIIEEGHMWGQILEILQKKAQAGLEVRVLYDGMNEFKNLPHNYPKKLAALGIKCQVFDPVKPFLSTQYDYRDHRKIAVIDGKIAYTGGINLADEYINKRPRFGYWKDCAIRFRGKPVATFTRMFLEAWNIHADRTYYGDYIKTAEEINIPSQAGYVIPFGYCPLRKEKTSRQIYLEIINDATDYVHIMTPYFVIDETITDALLYAVRRGVDVYVLVPHIPDKKAMRAVSWTYYSRLTNAGVRFFEYSPGFLHAKMIISDDRKAVVGSINMDYRSFYHHFENGVYLVDAPVISEIENDFKETLFRSDAITLANIKHRGFFNKIWGSILRVFAPLL